MNLKELLSQHKFKLLLFAAGFQILVLIGEYANSVYPLIFGKEIMLKIIPVDPRSLLRGHYARLDYDINTVTTRGTELDHVSFLPAGTIVYVTLTQSADVYVSGNISLDKPDKGLFIRGRLKYRYRAGDNVTIKYGIEAYFAKKEISQEIENRVRKRSSTGELTESARAIVKIAPNGKAALEDLFFVLN